MAGGLLSRSRAARLFLAKLSGLTSDGHQFLGGSFMNMPATKMPTVMMAPWTRMKSRTEVGESVPTPAPVEKPPTARMNGTEPYAQPPLTNPVRQPFFSGYHLATMLIALEYTIPEPMPPSAA